MPCTSRTLVEPHAQRENKLRLIMRTPALTQEQRWNAVGAWRLGRVMDSAAVAKPDQHTMTVGVRVEWVGWRALQADFPGSEIGGTFVGKKRKGLLSRPRSAARRQHVRALSLADGHAHQDGRSHRPGHAAHP